MLAAKVDGTPPPRPWRQLLFSSDIFSWSLYDWANSAFATTVMAGFFPVFFKKFWSSGTDINLSTFQLGFANSTSSALLAVLSPLLGAIADQGSNKKRILIGFTFLGVVMTGALSLVGQGQWQLAVMLYVLASIGFSGANIFYDALLVFVARPAEMNFVSAYGFSLGYLGGGLLFAINVLMTLKPEYFGLNSATEAVRLSFATVAVWWAVFTLPIMIFLNEGEEKKTKVSAMRLALRGLEQVRQTFSEIRSLRNIGLFLLAYFFYIDGVNTMIRMAVDYGLSLGFASESLIVALLITQFVGFPSAIGFGILAQKVGAKIGIYLAITVYTAVNIFAFFMQEVWQFYLLAIVIGLVQGGIQSLSRSVFGRMTPPDKAGEYFGFFNMLGKFSSMMGPFLVGVVSYLTQNTRVSILSIIVLFIVGGVTLKFVDVPDR